jgi:hypothetical protein
MGVMLAVVALVAGGCGGSGATPAGSDAGSSGHAVTSASTAADAAEYVAFLNRCHKLRIRFDQVKAKVDSAPDVHPPVSGERLQKAGDVFAEEAPRMNKVAHEMASVKAPPELKDSYAAYVAYIQAYANVLPAMARDAHAGKAELVLGDIYGMLDNTERAGFKSKLIQQLRQRDIQVPWWLKHLG